MIVEIKDTLYNVEMKDVTFLSQCELHQVHECRERYLGDSCRNDVTVSE